MTDRRPRTARDRGESTSTSSHGYSSDESCEDLPGRLDRKFPVKASDWKTDHLSLLRIVYEESPMDLSTFISMLKTRINSGDGCKMTKLHETMLQFTKESWKISFDFDKEYLSKNWDVVKMVREQTEEAMQELQEERSRMAERLKATQNDSESLEVYYTWKSNLLAFWRFFCKLLTRWDRPLQRKGRFSHLFMAFSRICFLDPEPGDVYSEVLDIKDTKVRSIPDVRFVAFTPAPAANNNKQLVVVTEVEQHDTFRGEYKKDMFTADNVSKRVLGQHGIELLMERKSSFFSPGVVGILCIGTKVMFTYLPIDQAHYIDIVERGEVSKTRQASISYTRPYDYMDASDRQQILEPLFWFGYVQSNADRFRVN